jgi:hypothetical protein
MKLPLCIREQIAAIDLLIRNRMLVVACKAIYCLIDQMSFLAMPPDQPYNEPRDFKEFFSTHVETNLASKGRFDADDLYSIRCGALHSNTWRGQHPSHSVRRNLKWSADNVAVICASADDCMNTIDYPLDDFWRAVKCGICNWFKNADGTNPVLQDRLRHSLEFWYVQSPPKTSEHS